MSLLSDVPSGRWRSIEAPDADLRLWPELLPPASCERFLARLEDEIVWEQQWIRVRGRQVPCPRLSAWYGDPGARYAYSGLELEPLPWTPLLLEIKQPVEAATGVTFNSVLANQYRDGADGMGLHADDEPELGPEPLIASVSVGAVRRFRLRHRGRRDVKPVVLDLESGSLLVMQGPTQRHWRHEVAKTRRRVGIRINLTFRRVGCG
jgi:alkylated DNA repair dioxygenase AlkB